MTAALFGNYGETLTESSNRRGERWWRERWELVAGEVSAGGGRGESWWRESSSPVEPVRGTGRVTLPRCRHQAPAATGLYWCASIHTNIAFYVRKYNSKLGLFLNFFKWYIISVSEQETTSTYFFHSLSIHVAEYSPVKWFENICIAVPDTIF